MHRLFHKYWNDPFINFLLPLQRSELLDRVQNLTTAFVYRDGRTTKSLCQMRLMTVRGSILKYLF